MKTGVDFRQAGDARGAGGPALEWSVTRKAWRDWRRMAVDAHLGQIEVQKVAVMIQRRGADDRVIDL